MGVRFQFQWMAPLLLLVMLMLIGGLIPTFPFGSDEGDNILGALSVLRGGDIYNAFYSQHMPFGYYFTALLGLCGAKSVLGFRIAYAVVLTLFWAWLYWFYARRLPVIMRLFLLLAYPLSAPYFLGHVILADNLSALALLVLMLELLCRGGEAEELKPTSMAVIALASFGAVTSSFLSVYPIAAFMAGLVVLELRRVGWRPGRFPFRRYILLAVMMLFPFAVLVGWYALTGNLNHFYYQAYEFNRTIYAKYVWIGGQPSPLTGFVLLPLAWLQHGLLSVTTALQSWTMSLDLLLIVSNLAFIIFIRRGWVFAVVLFFFMTYTGTRSCGGFGYTGFHSAPYFAVSLVALGWLIAALSQPHRFKIAGLAVLFLIFLKLTVPAYGRSTLPVYWKYINSGGARNPEQFFATPYDAEIRSVTKPGDLIWSAGVDGYIYINNRCRPASRLWGLVPWFIEDYVDEIIADLEKNKPGVIVFPAEGMVWGHALKDFGAGIQRYIQTRYHPLDENIPVKKDIYLLNNLPAHSP